MKILLINPPSSLDKIVLDLTSDVPPLGLMDIGTQALDKGHDVMILDGSVNRYSIEKIVSEAIAHGPDIVGITSLSSNYIFSTEIAKGIRKRLSVPVVLGGVHATSMPYECVKSGIFDYVVSGEADESFVKLVEAIKENGKKDIPGVNYMRDNKAVLNEPGKFREIKDFKMRSWGLVDVRKYRPSPASYKRLPAISTLISRGCSHHKCIFCASRLVFGEGCRIYSLEQIKEELLYFKSKGIRDINFVDINFTSDRIHTLEICDVLKELDLEWNITTRCDCVDPELLKIMKRSGCYQIGYGVEVGMQKELDMIKKNYTIEQIKKAVENTISAGISAKCFFTIGFPWQRKEDIQRTVDFAKELNPDIAIFSIINPYPGTELFGEYHGKKYFSFRNMQHRSAANSISEYFNEKELLRFMNGANMQFYLRPKFALSFMHRHIKGIRTIGDFFNIFRGVRYLANR